MSDYEHEIDEENEEAEVIHYRIQFSFSWRPLAFSPESVASP